MLAPRAVGSTTVATASAGNWEYCVTPVPLQPCHLPLRHPFAPADGDAGGVEATQKMLLSKPPLATAPRRREPLTKGVAKGPGHAPARRRGQVPFPRQHPPSPAAPAPPSLPSHYWAPRHVLPLICALPAQCQPRRAACPASALSRGSATSTPSERSCGSFWHPPGMAQHHGSAGAQPPSRAASSHNCRRVPRAPWDPPEPRSEHSPSVLAAPTNGHPRDLRGERGGRGVPADQGGGGVLVPRAAARGSPWWAPG